jgi:diguanylate cyclase (GGDEF)-like protein/PAS domain S-box-containing protein
MMESGKLDARGPLKRRLVDALLADLTQAEPAAQYSAHLERLVDAIGLPIGRWDRDFQLTFCNTPYTDWAGRPREQLLGRTLVELFGEAAWAAARDAFARAFGGESSGYDRLLTHRDGPPRWARIQAFPERRTDGRVDAIYTIAFDIDDDVALREELEQARRRLDRFAENIPYPLTYVDRDFVLRFVNRAYTQAVGLPASQLIGRPIGEVRGARRWAEHRPYFERALAGETCDYTRLTELVHLGPRWVRTTYSPDLDAAGQVVGIYTTTVDVHELTLAQQALRRSVERDALTDVLSRRALMDWVDVAVARCTTEPIALFFIDLDDFKTINDAHGHRAGDAALVAAARALQGAVRGDDALGRFGGDEFLVIARLPDRAAAQTLAQHLLEAVRSSWVPTEPAARSTASIGYALAPGDAMTSLELLRRADDAMYAAKRAGGDRALHCADPARP